MVYTQVSGTCGGNSVEVQVLSSAPIILFSFFMFLLSKHFCNYLLPVTLHLGQNGGGLWGVICKRSAASSNLFNISCYAQKYFLESIDVVLCTTRRYPFGYAVNPSLEAMCSTPVSHIPKTTSSRVHNYVNITALPICEKQWMVLRGMYNAET